MDKKESKPASPSSTQNPTLPFINVSQNQSNAQTQQVEGAQHARPTNAPVTPQSATVTSSPSGSDKSNHQ